MKPYCLLFLLLAFASLSYPESAHADVPENAPNPQVKYRSGSTVDFESLLIQGQIKRPEMSVVTGNVREGDSGLLRLRENFLDEVAIQAGEQVP